MFGFPGPLCCSTTCSLWRGAEMHKGSAEKTACISVAWSTRLFLGRGTTEVEGGSRLAWCLYKAGSLRDYPVAYWVSLWKWLALFGYLQWFYTDEDKRGFFSVFFHGAWIKTQCYGSWNMTENCPHQLVVLQQQKRYLSCLSAVGEDMRGTMAKVVVSALMSHGGTKRCWHLPQFEAALNLCISLWTGPGHSKGMARGKKKGGQK